MTFGFEVAGIRYRFREFQEANVQPGDLLELKAEPDNSVDDGAIAVYKGQVKFGYVPRSHNWTMLDALKEGRLSSVASSVWPRGCFVKVTARDAGEEAKAV